MTTDRNNSGTLAKNDRKTLDRHPDIRGQCIIDGRAYWIAGWQRKNEYGTFYSLAFTPKEPPTTATTVTQATHEGKTTYTAEPPAGLPDLRKALDDEIPF